VVSAKCCLDKDNQAATERMSQERVTQDQLDRERREFNQRFREHARALMQDDWLADERALCALSNSVLDLVRERRFDAALAACTRLLDEYPDVIDGLERSAIVHQAQGNHALADFYRRCIAFIEQPERREGFDDDAIDYYREQLRKLEPPADFASHRRSCLRVVLFETTSSSPRQS
jgi:tetratricopeptide (TPR) repeat protein